MTDADDLAPGEDADTRHSGAAHPAGRPARDRKSPTLTDQAYVRLEELITTLQLPPGAFLSEFALSERLALGRTPIREALQRLARDGLVTVMARRGILVSDIDLKSQLRLLETRRVLEALLARLAAERADEAERVRFRAVAAEMLGAAGAADDIGFMRLDREFNELVAAAARNEFAVRSISTMTALARRFWYQHYRQVGDMPLAARLHAEVAEAIARGDIGAASAASDRLMDHLEDFARKTLDI